METKVVASFAIFCLVAAIFISSSECVPLTGEKGILDPLTGEEFTSQGLTRVARQWGLGYPGYLGGGIGPGLIGGGGSSSSAAAAASSSSSSGGPGGLGGLFPYGRK